MRQPIQLFSRQAVLRHTLAVVLFLTGISAAAQHKKSSGPLSAIENADISAGIFGQFTSRIAATSQPVAQSTSDSSGALFSFHKSYHWWLGYDANYAYTSFSEYYTETYAGECTSFPGTSQPTICIPTTPAKATVPTSMHEFTGAYLVKSPISLLGLRPYGEVGLGDLLFAPSVNSTEVTFPVSSTYGNFSQQVSAQNRIAGLYAIGVDAPLLTSHLGARFEYRNLWYKAPSFGADGLLNANSVVVTQEPVASLYFKF